MHTSRRTRQLQAAQVAEHWAAAKSPASLTLWRGLSQCSSYHHSLLVHHVTARFTHRLRGVVKSCTDENAGNGTWQGGGLLNEPCAPQRRGVSGPRHSRPDAAITFARLITTTLTVIEGRPTFVLLPRHDWRVKKIRGNLSKIHERGFDGAGGCSGRRRAAPPPGCPRRRDRR